MRRSIVQEVNLQKRPEADTSCALKVEPPAKSESKGDLLVCGSGHSSPA